MAEYRHPRAEDGIVIIPSNNKQFLAEMAEHKNRIV